MPSHRVRPMTRALRAAGRLLRLLTVAAVLAATLTVAALAVIHYTGRQVLVVTSGSMAPVFRAGDVVLVEQRPQSQLRPGMIVTFVAPTAKGRLTTHRIRSVDHRPEGLFLQTKGDANPAPDPDLTPARNVLGVLTSTVPYAGWWLAFYQSPTGNLLILGSPLLLMMLSQGTALWRMFRRMRATGGSSQHSMPRAPSAAAARTAVLPSPAVDPDDPVAASRRRLVAASVVLTIAVCSALGILLGQHTGALFTAAGAVPANTFTTRPSFCAHGPAYATAVGQDHPTLWYRFAEGTTAGGATDSSGYSYDGRYVGAVTLWHDSPLECERGTSAAFGTGTAHVTSGDPVGSSGDGSVEAWLRAAATSAGGWIVGLGSTPDAASPSTARVLFVDHLGHLGFTDAAAGEPPQLVTGASYRDGRWHHVVVTLARDNRAGVKGIRLYVDGSLAGTADWKGTGTATGYLRVGWDALPAAPGVTTPFDGQVAEVATYAGALSADRVSAHYRAATDRQG